MQKIDKWRGTLAVGLLAAAFLGAYGGELLQVGLNCVSLIGFGGTATSGNFQLLAAGGQAGPVGTAASANFQLNAGAIYCLQLNTVKPELVVSQDTLDFGESSDSLSLEISNSTGGTLTWTVTENPDKPWLTSITPTSGSGDATVVITVDRTHLSGTSDAGVLNITSNGGNRSVAVRISKVGNPSSVDNATIQGAPQNFSLQQNYPNPFNPTTTITYNLPEAANIVLKIYNVFGHEVRTLLNVRQQSGAKSVVWDGRNELGMKVSSGIFVYRLQAGTLVETKKMILLK